MKQQFYASNMMMCMRGMMRSAPICVLRMPGNLAK